MAAEIAPADSDSGRKVRPDTLMVSPDVLHLPLAEPWRRLFAILVDLVMVGMLSLLSGPFLGLATGALLIVLLGDTRPAPIMLVVSRWFCRALGAIIVILSALALGHSSVLRSDQLNLDALRGGEASAAVKKSVFVPSNASYGQMMQATRELQDQVDDLKAELQQQRVVSRSWTGQAVAFTGALGVTFGWAGVYFTLLTGLCNGRTVGKLLLQIRAVKINGTRFTCFDGFVRQGGYVAGVAMGMIGFLKLLWEPNRQGVQDRIAGTVVVRN